MSETQGFLVDSRILRLRYLYHFAKEKGDFAEKPTLPILSHMLWLIYVAGTAPRILPGRNVVRDDPLKVGQIFLQQPCSAALQQTQLPQRAVTVLFPRLQRQRD